MGMAAGFFCSSDMALFDVNRIMVPVIAKSAMNILANFVICFYFRVHR